MNSPCHLSTQTYPEEGLTCMRRRDLLDDKDIAQLVSMFMSWSLWTIHVQAARVLLVALVYMQQVC